MWGMIPLRHVWHLLGGFRDYASLARQDTLMFGLTSQVERLGWVRKDKERETPLSRLVETACKSSRPMLLKTQTLPSQMPFKPLASIVSIASIAAYLPAKRYQRLKGESSSYALAACCTVIVFMIQYGKAIAGYA